MVAEGGAAGDLVKTNTVEDSSSQTGWSIADKHEFRTARSPGGFTQPSGNGAFRVGISGPGSNSAASGGPTITSRVFRVPAELSVDFSGVTDADGVADAAPTATYRWQRFDAAGTTLEQDNIGSDATYTLTDADAGKTIKVVVSFEDDKGFAEGPLTSDDCATPSSMCGCNTR